MFVKGEKCVQRKSLSFSQRQGANPQRKHFSHTQGDKTHQAASETAQALTHKHKYKHNSTMSALSGRKKHKRRTVSP